MNYLTHTENELAVPVPTAVTFSTTAVTPVEGTPPTPVTRTSAVVPAPSGTTRGRLRES